MAVPKRKWSRARSRKLHANWKLVVPNLVKCPHCHGLMMPHRVCKACGFYKGKAVLPAQE